MGLCSDVEREASFLFIFVLIFDLINVFLCYSGLMYRRGARRWRKIYHYNGHSFVTKRFGKVSIFTIVWEFGFVAMYLMNPRITSDSLKFLTLRLFCKISKTKIERQ